MSLRELVANWQIGNEMKIVIKLSIKGPRHVPSADRRDFRLGFTRVSIKPYSHGIIDERCYE